MADYPSFPKTLVVVGLPDADADKIAKMQDFLLNKMKERGCVDWETFDPIVDSNGKCKGAAIITFVTESNARKFFTEINNGFKFGKSPLGVVRIDDVEDTLDKRPEEPSPANAFLVRDNLHYYIRDERCREQLLIRAGDDTTVAWVDPTESGPVIQYDGEREKAKGQVMTEGPALWSPKGSFLVTLHNQGVNVWGGPETNRLRRFDHKRVQGVSFSPNEEYLLTWNGGRHEEEDGSHKNAIRLFEVQTGSLLTTFDCPVSTPANAAFPNLVWSADSKFLAGVMGTMVFEKNTDVPAPSAPGFAPPQPQSAGEFVVEKAALSVWAIPTCEVVKTIRRPMNMARSCAWSPRGARLAVWSAENGSQPSVLEVLSLPDGQVVASKNVFKAVTANLVWHPRGDFLGTQMKIASKSGKTFSYSLEVLRLREGGGRGVPVETFKLPDATIRGFSWDPTAPRFVYMSEIDGHSRVRTLHLCSTRGDSTVEVATLELTQPFSDIRWSPLGTHLCIAAFARTNGLLDGPVWQLQINGGNLLQANHNASAKGKQQQQKQLDAFGAASKSAGETPSRIEILAMNKQFMLNSVEWDHSGRYLMLSVQTSQLGNMRYVNDTGYSIFTFQGKAVLIENRKKLMCISFRPHPASTLTDDQTEAVRRDLRSYTKKFEEADEAKRNEQARLFSEARAAKQNVFNAIVDRQAAFKKTHAAHTVFKAAEEKFETTRKYREVDEEIEEVEIVSEEIVEEQEVDQE